MNIENAAGFLGAARGNGAVLPDLADDLRPADESEAYVAQAALSDWFAAHGHGEPAGYKIGATTQSMQAYLGAPGPAFGRIMANNIHASGTVLPGSGLVNPGVECEIAFRLNREPPAAPVARDDLWDCIESVMPAMEIVENRYDDFLARGFPTLVADDFFHKACVLGAPVDRWREIDLANIGGRMEIDGAEVGTGTGADVMGHPLEPIAWLIGALATHGRTLKAGEIVLTGSMTPVHWIETLPATAKIDITGLGEVAVGFE